MAGFAIFRGPSTGFKGQNGPEAPKPLGFWFRGLEKASNETASKGLKLPPQGLQAWGGILRPLGGSLRPLGGSFRLFH